MIVSVPERSEKISSHKLACEHEGLDRYQKENVSMTNQNYWSIALQTHFNGGTGCSVCFCFLRVACCLLSGLASKVPWCLALPLASARLCLASLPCDIASTLEELTGLTPANNIQTGSERALA